MMATVMLPILTLAPVSAQPEVKRFRDSAPTQTVAAAQVGDVPLLWTGQIYGWSADGRVTGGAQEQAEAAVRHLRAALSAGESRFELVVRINAYVTSDEVTPVLMALLHRAFGQNQPSITVVATPLAETGAVLALDAVAASSGSTGKVELVPVSSFPKQSTGLALARVPVGRKVFISGQAEPAATLREATRLTMESLGRSLVHLGTDKSSVVQVKAFLQPFEKHQELTEEIVAFFEGQPVPPIILMAWTNSLPTEIELVASGGRAPAASGDYVWFSTLPNLAASPRFSRAAVVEPGAPLLFTSSIYGSAGLGARQELRDIFATLGTLLFDVGSGYRQLVKATYFNTDAAGPKTLGEIRAVYFDPTRPPAASAVGVKTLGRSGFASSLDMIAVPLPPAK